MAGSFGDARFLSLSENILINSLLSRYVWGASTITFSFPSVSWHYQSGYFSDWDLDGYNAISAFENFAGFRSDQIGAARFALEANVGGAYSVEGFTLRNFAEVSNGSGIIRLANSNDPGTNYSAYSLFPANTATGGDVFLGNSAQGFAYAGSFAWWTTLHEIGHALGLRHPHQGLGDNTAILPNDWDTFDFSIMTYNSYSSVTNYGYRTPEYNHPQTFMMLDIRALQYQYGADYSVNGGNTTYSWDPASGRAYVNGFNTITPAANIVYQTIWDGNGIDLYNLQNYTTNLYLNLNPGWFIDFSSGTNFQNAHLGDGYYARGNVFNALQWGSDTRSLIENAWGGTGNDRMIGNVVGNYLWGNSGDDTLEGGAGNDTLDGSAGQDRLWGGAGDDNFRFRFLSDYRAGAPDIINDMQGVGAAWGDVIDISAIDANVALAGNQAFLAGQTSIGGMATFNNGSYTEVRLYVDAAQGADAYIWINDGAVVAGNYRTDEFFL
jgi:serralysin